jgi:hypothetical protein
VPKFVPAADLNAAFYDEAVAPLVSPWRHSAALLSWGSDVLGFDDVRSTDHGWGPRLVLFAEPRAIEPMRQAVDAGMPSTFRGWPVRYGWDKIAPRHWVEVRTLADWLDEQLGCDPGRGMSLKDWLLVPQQRLLGVVRGAVYHDGLGELARVRSQLAWYPDGLWVWLVGSQWRRIAQEEAFVGRAAEVGDELGSRLVAARLVREVIRLAFLLARQYAPYTKWLGTAFARLNDPDDLGPELHRVVGADTYAGREDALAAAFEIMARRHNATAITEPLDPTTRPYLGRPYRVILADRFVDACLARITDPRLAALPPIGSVDQLADSTDALTSPATARRLERIYDS